MAKKLIAPGMETGKNCIKRVKYWDDDNRCQAWQVSTFSYSSIVWLMDEPSEGMAVYFINHPAPS